MTVDAHPRGAARHQAVHRRAVAATSTRSATPSTRSSRAGDVRLTMGGEPTFVSIDDLDGAEWNTAALGPDEAPAAPPSSSQRLRDALRARRARCTSARASGIRASRCRAGRSPASGARDGEPIWRDPRSLADERGDDGAHGAADAERFCRGARRAPRRRPELRRRRPTRTSATTSGARRDLPANVDPARLQARRSGWSASGCAASSAGPRQRPSGTCCRLQPRGDGLRLADAARGFLRPSAATWCPAIRRWAAPAARLAALGSARSDFRRTLEPRSGSARGRFAGRAPRRAPCRPDCAPARGSRSEAGRVGDRGSSRTALCVEPRDGVLHVFMPPRRRTLEDYLDLVAAVEDTAAKRVDCR